MSGTTRLGLLLVIFLLCVVGVAVLGPGTAAAQTCVDNPDGTTTCTSTFPNPPGINCPVNQNDTVSTDLYVDYPANSTYISHQLSGSCSGASLSEIFNPDAPGAPSGYKAGQSHFTFTCTQIGGCGAPGKTAVTLDLTYSNPPLTSLFPPDPQALTIPKSVSVHSNRATMEMGLEEREGVGPVDLNDGVLFYFAGAIPHKKPRSATVGLTSKSHKRIKIGTFPDTHLLPGQKVTLPLTLNARGGSLLRRTGKLSTTLVGTLRNSAGTATLTRKLKLVLKK